MEIWYLLAGVSGLITALTHTFVGGKFVARPLLATSDLHRVSLYTNYYCWHIVTIVLFSISAMFFYAMMRPEAVEIAWVATLYCAAFVAWSFAMIVWKRLKFREFPQWALIVPTTLFGFLGLIS
jgi:hypothetical protein